MRLTNTMKKDIVNALVANKFPETVKDGLKKAVTDKLKKFITGEYEKAGGEKIEGFVFRRKMVQIYDGYSKVVDLYFDTPLPVMNCYALYNDHNFQLKKMPECAMDEVKGLVDFIYSRDEFKASLEKLVQAMNTDSMLFELIPEAKGLVSVEKSAGTSLVPMALVESIRRTLAA